MYCRNCCNQLSPNATVCIKCGVPSLVGNKYCYNCASPTDEKAIICVNCGVSFQAPKTDFDARVIIYFWNAFPYSTYIIILLFSLLPFINFKCANRNIESVTGLNMAIGAKRTYTKVNPNKWEKYGMQPYGYEKYTHETENLFTWDIALFYTIVLICIYILFGSSPKKYKHATGWTILGLILLIEWFVVVSLRKEKYENNLIEISFGVGFWLTLFTISLSLTLLLFYLKGKENSRRNSNSIVPPKLNQYPPPINLPYLSSPPPIPKTPIEINELASIPPSIIKRDAVEQSKKSAIIPKGVEKDRKKKTLIILSTLLGLLIIAGAIWYFAINHNVITSQESTYQSPSDTSTTKEQSINTILLEKNAAKNALINFFTALSNKDISQARLYATQDSDNMLQIIENAFKQNIQKESESFDINSIEIGEPMISNEEAIITVKEKKTSKIEDYELKKENGSWKVKFDNETVNKMGMKSGNDVPFKQQKPESEESTISEDGNSNLNDKSKAEEYTGQVFSENEVDDKPKFPGGDEAFVEYITSHFNMYNTNILNHDYKSFEVAADFLIDENGYVKKIIPVSHIGYGVEKEYVRIIKQLPKFIPAQLNGRNVACLSKHFSVIFYK